MKVVTALWAVWFAYWLLAARGAAKAREREDWRAKLVHRLVLVAAFLLLLSDHARVGLLGRRLWPESGAASWAGAGLTAAGLLFAVWARAHLGRYWSAEVQIKEGHRLIRTGPYAGVRHPIYTGVLFAILGSALALGEVRGLVFVAATLAAFWAKLRKEEALLSAEFGREYDDYRRRTKALVPFVL